MTEGKTVALTHCQAFRDNESEFVSGLYTLIERIPYEPSNYCWSSGWLIAPVDDDSEDACIFVEEYTLLSQVDPKTYSQVLMQEREMEWAEQEMELIED